MIATPRDPRGANSKEIDMDIRAARHRSNIALIERELIGRADKHDPLLGIRAVLEYGRQVKNRKR